MNAIDRAPNMISGTFVIDMSKKILSNVFKQKFLALALLALPNSTMCSSDIS
jgi:hypothetical protein